MPSLREQILQRIKDLLTGATPAGAQVYRSREEPITRNLSPAIIIVPSTETTQALSEYADRNDLDVDVIVIARGDVWDAVADTVAVPLHTLIMNDAQLEALCQHMRRFSADWQGKEADLTAGALTMKYRFVYLANALDIARAPIT
jgi:hypothetical protein